ncbi:DoxX family protein [Spirosoma arcticum]
MNRWFKSVASPAALHGWLFLLRIAIAGMMLTHGIPKLQKILVGNWEFGDPLGLGAALSLALTVFAEVVCSVLLLIGLFTRFATLPLLFTMLVAFFIVHGADEFGKRKLPMLYALVYATLFFTGPGKYSVDGRRGDL